MIDESWTAMMLRAEKELTAALTRIRELEADNANWKRLYERRGLALARPCIACGHVPAVIKPTSQPDRGR
jgi:hypothetical protein